MISQNELHACEAKYLHIEAVNYRFSRERLYEDLFTAEDPNIAFRHLALKVSTLAPTNFSPQAQNETARSALGTSFR
jgi:hypothetical protein